ncbi:MAG: hypothetical protein ACRDXB_16370, partial [Actinomycetes bacterium]
MLRTDLRRSRKAALGADVHPEAVLFASRLARAVTETPESGLDARTLPALRDAVFGGGIVPAVA